MISMTVRVAFLLNKERKRIFAEPFFIYLLLCSARNVRDGKAEEGSTTAWKVTFPCILAHTPRQHTLENNLKFILAVRLLGQAKNVRQRQNVRTKIVSESLATPSRRVQSRYHFHSVQSTKHHSPFRRHACFFFFRLIFKGKIGTSHCRRLSPDW